MLSLFLFLLSSIGLTFIIVKGSIFEKLRTFVISQSDFLGEWISCPQCFGFFIGFICSIFGLNQTYTYLQTDYWVINWFVATPISFFLDGAIASLAAMTYDWFSTLIENYNNFLLEYNREKKAVGDIAEINAIQKLEELNKIQPKSEDISIREQLND
jgi:hypothetical protein